MSIQRQLAPVLGLIDKPALSNSVPLVINIQNHFQHVEVRGHSYHHPTIIAKAHTQAHFGDSAVMCKSSNFLCCTNYQTRTMERTSVWVSALIAFQTAHSSRYSRNNGFTYDPNMPLPTDKTLEDQTSGSGSASGDADPRYRNRDYDWFTPGRLFIILAPSDEEIHEKQFILLDTKNKEGPGLLIKILDEEKERENKGYFLRSHVLVRNYSDSSTPMRESKINAVYIDEYDDHSVEPGTWIALEHTYNIPFAKYKCIDCGMIDRGSLKLLRRCYVAWLRYHWGLGS